MIDLAVPGRGDYSLTQLVLDMNGTLARDGVLLTGVASRVDKLRSRLDIVILTADTHGSGRALAAKLGARLHRLEPGAEAEQKAAFINEHGALSTVAIGNGANDVGMLRAAALGIAVLGPEGAVPEAITAADVLTRDVNEALDLLLHPLRLVATLRR